MVLDEDSLPPVGRVLSVPEGGQAVAVHVGRHGQAREGLEGGGQVDVGDELVACRILREVGSPDDQRDPLALLIGMVLGVLILVGGAA